MSTAEDLLVRTRDLGIHLWVSDGMLRYRAPRAALSAQLRGELHEHKASLIDVLAGPRYVRAPEPAAIDIHEAYFETWNRIRTGIMGVGYTNATNMVCRFRGAIALPAIERALQRLARRHNALRSRITDDEHGLRLVFDSPPRLTTVDLTACDAAEVDSAIVEAAQGIVWRPFSAGECLFRPFVLELPSSKLALGFVVHHFVVDGVSFGQIPGYWMAEYERELCGQPEPDGAPQELQCSDFMLGLEAWSKTRNFERRLDYWRATLHGATSSCLPPDRPVVADAKSVYRCQSLRLDAARVARLRELAATFRVTLFDVLLAGIAMALRGELQTSDVCLRHLWHGRDEPELFQMVGSTVNPIVLRMNLGRESPLSDVARQVHRVALEAFANQVPSYYVEKMLAEMGATALVQTNFPLLDADDLKPGSAAASPFVAAFPVPNPNGGVATPRATPAHDVNLSVADGALWCNVVYVESIYDDATIARFVAGLDHALN